MKKEVEQFTDKLEALDGNLKTQETKVKRMEKIVTKQENSTLEIQNALTNTKDKIGTILKI